MAQVLPVPLGAPDVGRLKLSVQMRMGGLMWSEWMMALGSSEPRCTASVSSRQMQLADLFLSRSGLA